jgi:hypothetical protein
MAIKIINSDGCATRTSNVAMHNAHTHIAARDRHHNEAEILLAYDADESLVDRDPIAFKYNDPTEDARFLFDESEVAEIEAEAPHLIERIAVVWE